MRHIIPYGIRVELSLPVHMLHVYVGYEEPSVFEGLKADVTEWFEGIGQ
jgi:hypothetical protein